jgi:CBS domain-containing protein
MLRSKGVTAVGRPAQLGPSLQQLKVIDAMHPGVIFCPVETPLRVVARMMATYRVHAIIVTAQGSDELPDGSLWGVVSDVDVMQAAHAGDLDEQFAGKLAGTPALMVATTEPLTRAVELMVEHEVTHLVVVEQRSMRPIGVLSTLDVARALAGFPSSLPS